MNDVDTPTPCRFAHAPGHRRMGALLCAIGWMGITLGACTGDDGGGSGDGAPALPPSMLPKPVTNADGRPPAVPFDASTPRVAARALASFAHDTAAYTQGLVVAGTRLLEGTGIEGRSQLREVVRTTGEVKARTPIPSTEFGEGIALVDGRVYQLTWRGGRGHVYDARSLAPVDSFTYGGEGWGLATDGTQLFMSDGTARIRVIAPKGFTVVRTIDVTEAGRSVPMLNELEWVDGELWANVYQTDLIARIDPANGHVTGWVDLRDLLTPTERTLVAARGGTANGIAYDASRKRVLVTGKLWPKLFEIEVPPRK